ncbi:MAG: 16S rRNA (cytosine(1402)-N(4))-methyltransferase, partial [Alphaproteobacteria bacterium]
FQALRLEVNRELEVLTDVITQLIPLLKIGGRLAIISFHSLEDRIVKNLFKEAVQGLEYPVEVLTKKPIVPGEEEIFDNSRSRSAKLRVIERITAKKEKNKYKQI